MCTPRRRRSTFPTTLSVMALGLAALGLSAPGCQAQQPAEDLAEEEAAVDEAAPAETGAMAGVEVARSGGGTATLPLNDGAAMAELQGRTVTPPPTLDLTFPEAGQVLEEGPLEVGFEIRDFEVGRGPDVANQHVHVILDDRPYEADYAPTGTVTFSGDALPQGTHVLTAFLAREMHLSLKNPEASAQVLFHVGEQSADWTWQPGDPTLVYSRPKGSYSRSDGSAANIMLDFYLFNAELGPDAHAVRATVDDGEPTLITDWSPRIILENPELGEHRVRLELLDAEGNPVPGPSNDTTRTIEIVE